MYAVSSCCHSNKCIFVFILQTPVYDMVCKCAVSYFRLSKVGAHPGDILSGRFTLCKLDDVKKKVHQACLVEKNVCDIAMISACRPVIHFSTLSAQRQ